MTIHYDPCLSLSSCPLIASYNLTTTKYRHRHQVAFLSITYLLTIYSNNLNNLNIKNHFCYQAPDEKEKRTTVHQSIKKSFAVLETKTVEENGEKFIQAFWRQKKGLKNYKLRVILQLKSYLII